MKSNKKVYASEIGAAGITIVLEHGHITVTHSENGNLLHKVKHVKPGTWDKLWEAIYAIEKAEVAE